MNVTQAGAVPEPHKAGGPALTREDGLRRAAMIFVSGGFTRRRLREGKEADDLLFADLATAVDAIAAEGLTAEVCRELLGYPEDGEERDL